MVEVMVTVLSPDEVLRRCDGDVGAYVHVPFCSSICPFCPYNKVLARDDVAQPYFAALAHELTWFADALRHSGRATFTSLYVGGGTPTLYPEALAHIVRLLPVSGERAVEVLPLHGSPDQLDRLAASGFDAVSIGAQSFHDEVLRRLHRPHDAASSLQAVRNARTRFACVDVDLIVDVAWEDEPALAGAFLRDVRQCFDIGVDQVSTYPLMRFGYTPFGAAHHQRAREHELLHQVSRLASTHGYERRSVWTVNRLDAPGYTSITRPRFLGMGAGSASFTGADFFVNHFGIDDYGQAVAAGALPVARWLHLGESAGTVFEAFWQAYAGRLDPPASARLAWAARRLGLAESDTAGVHLTRRGYDLYHDLERAVTYQLIEPLWAEMLTEHRRDRTGTADWVRHEQARAGRAWSLVSRLLERPHVGRPRGEIAA
jgi:coproporphyrinogen III oxidase-like Fe-S oxidoreductase